MGRRIVAVLVGLLIAIVVIFAVELLSIHLYPMASGVDSTNPEAVRTAISQLPPGAFAFVLAGCLLGTAVGAAAAQRMSRAATLGPGLTVGAVLLVATAYNLWTIPHPTWVVVLAVLGIPAVAYSAARSALLPGAPTLVSRP